MVIMVVSLMVTIGFFTLLERKLLSLSQLRLGPNKTLMMGLIQPVLDGLKLMKKMILMSEKFLALLLNILSILLLYLSFLMWMAMPFIYWINKSIILLWMMLLFGLATFCLFLLGWASNNKYGLLGSTRGVAQTISVEMLISLTLFIFFFLNSKLSVKLNAHNFNFFMIYLALIYFILILMETHRAPMDLAEGESELVSGYNTELSSILFIFIFLSEYSNMIFLSLFMMSLYLKFSLIIMSMILIFLLLIRSCYPRVRYDILMNFSWKIMLPWLIVILFIVWPMKLL